jgi:acetyl-CoA carboxylase biotin carboxyl carrier protein
MKLKEIEELITFIAQLGLQEVNIETEELKLRIKKNAPMPAVQQTVASRPVVLPEANPSVPAVVPAVSSLVPPSVAAPEPTYNGKEVVIKSPMIGTFYRSAGPDKSPFVSEGDEVKAGQTVCIIEAMKLFNEIEAEVSGKITKILVDDASPVEYDQRLFIIEPA